MLAWPRPPKPFVAPALREFSRQARVVGMCDQPPAGFGFEPQHFFLSDALRGIEIDYVILELQPEIRISIKHFVSLLLPGAKSLKRFFAHHLLHRTLALSTH